MPRDWPGKAFRIVIREYVGWEVPCGSELLLMAAKLLQTSLHNAISSQRTLYLYNQAKALQDAVVLIIITLLIVLHLLTKYCFCFPLWSKRNCDEK